MTERSEGSQGVRGRSSLPTAGARDLTVVTVLAAVFYAVFIARTSFVVEGQRYFTLFDDAMVSMRYAANLAAGYGLVWNPGEQPVEGYTNLLWTLWMALVHLLPIESSKTSLVVMLTGMCILIADAAVVWRIAGRLGAGSRWVRTGAVLLVAFLYSLVFWTLRGMEVGLLVLMTNLAILLYLDWAERARFKTLSLLTVLLAASLLVRMDALVCFTVIWSFVVVSAPRRSRLVCLGLAFSSALIALGGQLAFRVAYYGEWLPNTYYLKMSAGGLGPRVARGLEVFGTTFEKRLYPVALVCALSLLVIWRRDRRWLARPEPYILPSVFLVQVGYSIYVGGDAWEWMGYSNRYLCIGLPALLVYCTATLGKAMSCFEQRAVAGRVATGLLVAVGLTMNASPLSKWARDNAIHAQDDADQVRVAVRLRSSTAPEATIAVVCAGAVPYFVDRQCIDLLGKNDRVLARGLPVAGEPFYPGHNVWNYEHSIGVLRPTVILQLWKPSAVDLEYVKSLGYVQRPEGHFLLEGSRSAAAAARPVFGESAR